MIRQKNIILIIMYLLSANIYSQKSKCTYDIDSVLNSKNHFYLEEKGGIIFWTDKDINLNLDKLSEKTEIYFINKLDTIGVKQILGKNDKKFFFLIDMELEIINSDYSTLKYLMYETSYSIFNTQIRWMPESKRKVIGFYVVSREIPLKYSPELDKWLPYKNDHLDYSK